MSLIKKRKISLPLLNSLCKHTLRFWDADNEGELGLKERGLNC